MALQKRIAKLRNQKKAKESHNMQIKRETRKRMTDKKFNMRKKKIILVEVETRLGCLHWKRILLTEIDRSWTGSTSRSLSLTSSLTFALWDN